MICEQEIVVSQLRSSLSSNPRWSRILHSKEMRRLTIHLAILRHPYLDFILEGKKTIESRFSRRRCAPFGAVSKGDIVLLKRPAGRIVGICVIEKVWVYHLN